MAINYLTYEFSTNCNMDCNFCFSDWREQNEMPNTEHSKLFLQILREKGLKAINFTGGEPLLRNDFGEVLQFAKDLGLTTILTTNGTLLEHKIADIADNLDFVGLPIDSSNEYVHNKLRSTTATTNHYKIVLGLTDLLHTQYNPIGIKINTIVTAENVDSIVGIGDMINPFAISWKLSQYVPSGFGKQFQDTYSIADQLYLEIVNHCRLAHPTINIVSNVAHERDACCRVLSSTGHLLKMTSDGLIDLGMLDTLSDQTIMDGFDSTRNTKVFQETYIGKTL